MTNKRSEEEYRSWAQTLGVQGWGNILSIASIHHRELKPVFEDLARRLKVFHALLERNCNYGVADGWINRGEIKMLSAARSAALLIVQHMRKTFPGEKITSPHDLQYVAQHDPRGWPLIVLRPGEKEGSIGFRPFLREY